MAYMEKLLVSNPKEFEKIEKNLTIQKLLVKIANYC